MNNFKKQVLAEFTGSFMLGFFGLGLVVAFAIGGIIKDMFEFAVLFGIIIAFTVIIFNPISGAQFNPGVTLAMVITKRSDKKILVPFITAQILGWGLGSGVNYIMFAQQCSEFWYSGAGNPVNLFFCSSPNIFFGAAFEFVATGILLMCICAMIDKRCVNRPTNAMFPFAITALDTFLISWAGGYTGAALNFARDLGPRIVAFIYGTIMGLDTSACFGGGMWLMYVIAPTAGAICGALFFDRVLSKLFIED